MSQKDNHEQKSSRRKLLKTLAAGGGVFVGTKAIPEKWTTPVVDSVLMPAHAQLSGCAERTISGMRVSFDFLGNGDARMAINDFLGDNRDFGGVWNKGSGVASINETKSIDGCEVTIVASATLVNRATSPDLTNTSWSMTATCSGGNRCEASGSIPAVVGNASPSDDPNANFFFDACASGTECCTEEGILPINSNDCD